MTLFQIGISEENVQEILPAARMLQLDYVVDQCAVFLEKQLSIQNCLGFYIFAGATIVLYTVYIYSLLQHTLHMYTLCSVIQCTAENNTVFYMYCLTDKHDCEQLLATARLFIQRNFTQVYARGEEFTKLPATNIIEVGSLFNLLFVTLLSWHDRVNV